MSNNTTKTTIELNRTKDQMPLVGLGTWKADNGVVEKVVELALKNSYKLVDCACDYGNEEEVGRGIQSAIEKGYCTRKELFVTSKLWNTYHRKEHVKEACQRSLKDLGLDYLDLYLIHFPISQRYVDMNERYPPGWAFDESDGKMEFDSVPIQQTWEAMEQLVDDGLVRNIGISNFSASLIIDLLRYARIRPAVLQIEHHAYLQQPSLIDWVQRQGIAVTGYSSFAQISYLALGDAFDWAKKLDNLLTEHKVIAAIAKKHNKSTAQVLLQWSVQRNVAVIPKSTNEDRIKQNIELDFILDQQDLDGIAGIDKHLRFNNPANYANQPIFE